MLLPSLLWSSSFISLARAGVTVYSQLPFGATVTAALPSVTAPAFNDTVVLTPPPVPSPAISTSFFIQLNSAPSGVPGLSIPQKGGFFGLSIEMSVVNQIIGRNSSELFVPFLNLMAALTQRGGRAQCRVGGNSQEAATLVTNITDGKIIQKQQTGSNNPTQTPNLDYSADLLYMLANVSAIVPIDWYLGIPFYSPGALQLQIAELGSQILGDRLIGLQVGNEPDLYAAHGHRPQTYGPNDYIGEFGLAVNAVNNDNSISNKKLLIGPSLSGTWPPELVWNGGFISSYSNSLATLSVEHYPSDNCNARFGLGAAVDPQTVLPGYLNHTAATNIVAPYLNSTSIAQANNLGFMMFETNTASCGGFPGLSDSFGAALWAVDYGLTMAYSNFTGGLIHVSGNDVYYNPFTPPPTNMSATEQWTVGPMFYALLFVAEAIGSSNTAQLVDLQANSANSLTPAYAIFENGECAKLVIINFVSDPTGASTLNVTFSIGGGSTGEANATPAQVSVKYLLAPSVTAKTNMTWAGQTFGEVFQSDGRLQGTLNIQTVTCDQAGNTCTISVPAPGAALVYLTPQALSESTPSTTQTFPTTFLTKTQNTATVPPSVLSTSNGHSGSSWRLASTSKESQNGARGVVIPGMAALVAMVCGAMTVSRVLTR